MVIDSKPHKRMNRRRPKLFDVDSFSLPIVLLEAIEREADLNYGGNKSALVTKAIADALNIPLPQEVMTQ